MPSYVSDLQDRGVWRPALQRLVHNCAASAVCLLAFLPAAHAHHDAQVPPGEILWGLIAFIIVTTWVVIMSIRAPRALHKKPLRPRRKRALPWWLQRLLDFDPLAGRMPRNASRQVRRAYLRRRK